jgi:hypothetical protein
MKSDGVQENKICIYVIMAARISLKLLHFFIHLPWYLLMLRILSKTWIKWTLGAEVMYDSPLIGPHISFRKLLNGIEVLIGDPPWEMSVEFLIHRCYVQLKAEFYPCSQPCVILQILGMTWNTGHVGFYNIHINHLSIWGIFEQYYMYGSVVFVYGSIETILYLN